MSLQNVLIAVDVFADNSARIIRRAIQYVPSPRVLRLVHVIQEPLPLSPDDTQFDGRERTRLRNYADERLTELCDQFGLAGYLIDFGHPASGIHRVAEQQEADLVVLGGDTHHGLLSLFGGTVRATLRGTPCNICVQAEHSASATAPSGNEQPQHYAYQRILAAVTLDNPSETTQLLNEAVRLANLHSARLSVVTVVQPPRSAGDLVARLTGNDRDRLLAEALDRRFDERRIALEQIAAAHNISANACQVLVGEPLEHIQRLANDCSAELLVLGTHGLHGMHALTGSATSELMRDPGCDVLAVKLDPARRQDTPPARLANRPLPEALRDREHMSLR